MGLISKLFTPAEGDKFELPVGTYYLARTVYAFRRFFLLLSRWETRRLKRRHQLPAVERPIYVTGIARAGTTISLEILSQHPDVATHRYFHMPNPFLPHWWDRFVHKLPLPSESPVERIHKDGIMVTRDSPEALEEPLWKAYFKGIHDETRSNVIDADVQNPKFETFYRDHMWKLVVSQERTRYVAKNNYAITRMEYLLRLYPGARFLLIIRNPINHMASYIKQNKLFATLGEGSKRLLKMTQLIGHHEFGRVRIFVNADSNDALAEVEKDWADGHEARGWARYWASVYGYVADRLDANDKLREATLVVRYEDLCTNSGEMLDKIIAHTGLDADKFAPIREIYVAKLKPPTYYKVGFSEAEIQEITEVAGPTAARFGYDADVGAAFTPAAAAREAGESANP
jgi:hypothetical protein